MKKKQTERIHADEQNSDLLKPHHQEQSNELNQKVNHQEELSIESSAWKPMAFFPRILYAVIVCLVLLIAQKGAFGQTVHQFTNQGLSYVFEHQFNFVKAKEMAEELLGSADLAFFLPNGEPETEKITEEVSARVITSFNETKTGVQIETHTHATVVSDVDGIVVFAGKKPEIGQTLIIQAEDGTEYWYGELEELKIKIYDSVSKDEVIGIAGIKDEGDASQYYFALKKDGKFMDPKQVLQLES